MKEKKFYIVRFGFLLILLLLLKVFSYGQGRVVINEFMPWSGCNTTSEYVELMNFGPGPMNIGCYIVTNGQYAVTIPANTVLQPGEYYVLAGRNTLALGCGNVDSAVSVDLNWATCNCTDKPIPTTGDGFFLNGGGVNEKVVLLSPSLSVMDAVTRSLPVSSSASITTSSNGGTCTPSTFDLDLLPISYEAISTATGIDNSYSRRVDGDCGWVKTTDISAGAPNKTGSTSSATYNFTTLSASECSGSTGSISIGVSASNVSSLFPMTYTLAYDADNNSVFDNNDTYLYGVDSTASSIDISNLAYGRYRITVGSSLGCNLQSYDFFIFNCYGVVLSYRVVSFKQTTVINDTRWFEVGVTGMDSLKSVVLEAKEVSGFKVVNTVNVSAANRNIETMRISAPVSKAELYRVRLVSKSGNVYYSNEIRISGSAVERPVQVWPNPVKGGHLNISGSHTAYDFTVVNGMGRVVMKGKVGMDSASQVGRVDISRLSPGVYELLLVSNHSSGYFQAIRFIKD